MRSARTLPGAVACGALAALLAGCATLAPRPLPAGVALEGVRVTRLTPQDTRLTVTLVVSNPNPYDLAVSALDASVAVDGEPLLTGTLLQPVQLAAGGDTRVQIEARTGFAAILGALDRFTRQRSVRYEVTGSAVVQDGWRLPFRRSGELPGADLLVPGR
jgi:LEA14-like dessication related protein